MSSKDKKMKQKPGKDYQYGGFEMEKYNNIVDFLHSNKLPDFGISNSDKTALKNKIGNFKRMCKDFCVGADGVTLLYIKTTVSKKKQAASKDPIAEEDHSDDSDQDLSSDLKLTPTQTESKARKVILKGQVKRVIEEVHKEVEAPTLHPVPPPREALTQWGIDLVNLPMAEGGYKHLVVAIKHLTKWVEARPLKTKGAGEVLEFFEELCSRIGMPKVLISDQGGEFCNKLLDGFCEANGIDHRMTAAYHPQSNGATDQANQTIKKQLRKIAEDNCNTWPKHLNRVLFGLRTHVPRATKYSPFELVYGFKARFAVDNKLEEGSEQAGEDDDEEQRIMIYLASIDAHFDGIKHQRKIAHANIKIEQAKQKKAYDEKHTPCPFKKGDLVKLQQSRKGTRQGGKMLPNFIGPLTVQRIKKSQTMILVDASGNKISSGKTGISRGRVLPWNEEAEDVDQPTKRNLKAWSGEQEVEQAESSKSSEGEGESPKQEQSTSDKDGICEAVTIKLPNPNARFSFKPPNVHYFDAICKKLRIRAAEPIKYGKECEFFVRAPPKQTLDVAGDGNCGFWALSLAMTGTEAFHAKLWKAVCSTLLQEHKEFGPFIGGADDSKLPVTNYLKESKMEQAGVWATGIELKAAARLLGVQIWTYSPTRIGLPNGKTVPASRWISIPPMSYQDATNAAVDIDNLPAIYLDNRNSHYNLVVEMVDADQ
uniref:Integrase catalytic domain-containing protein n=1 Tax=Plectus sambesii TaxID=2011161 RepID=A0A914UKM8_9BILA